MYIPIEQLVGWGVIVTVLVILNRRWNRKREAEQELVQRQRDQHEAYMRERYPTWDTMSLHERIDANHDERMHDYYSGTTKAYEGRVDHLRRS